MNPEKRSEYQRQLDIEFTKWWEKLTRTHLKNQADALAADHGPCLVRDEVIDALLSEYSIEQRLDKTTMREIADRLKDLTQSGVWAAFHFNRSTMKTKMRDYMQVRGLREIQQASGMPEEKFNDYRTHIGIGFGKIMELPPFQVEEHMRALETAVSNAKKTTFGSSIALVEFMSEHEKDEAYAVELEKALYNTAWQNKKKKIEDALSEYGISYDEVWGIIEANRQLSSAEDFLPDCTQEIMERLDGNKHLTNFTMLMIATEIQAKQLPLLLKTLSIVGTSELSRRVMAPQIAEVTKQIEDGARRLSANLTLLGEESKPLVDLRVKTYITSIKEHLGIKTDRGFAGPG